MSWYAVRCVFDTGFEADDAGHRVYEERITLWRAGGFDEAIALAGAEARRYDAVIQDYPVGRYLGLAQAYKLFDEPGVGAEIFSLMRGSPLEPDEYLDRFFDTGSEHQRGLDELSGVAAGLPEDVATGVRDAAEDEEQV